MNAVLANLNFWVNYTLISWVHILLEAAQPKYPVAAQSHLESTAKSMSLWCCFELLDLALLLVVGQLLVLIKAQSDLSRRAPVLSQRIYPPMVRNKAVIDYLFFLMLADD